MVQNVGLQPRLTGSSAAALINQNVVGDAQPPGDEAPYFLELADVIAGVRHRNRNAVGKVDNLDILPRASRNSLQCLLPPFHGCLEKSGVIKECPELVYFGSAGTNFVLCASNVFAILPASGVRTVG